MLCLQLCYAGFHIVSRTALNMGVSKVVFPVYRNIIALLILSPSAYFLEKYVIRTFHNIQIETTTRRSQSNHFGMFEFLWTETRDRLSHFLCWFRSSFSLYAGECPFSTLVKRWHMIHFLTTSFLQYHGQPRILSVRFVLCVSYFGICHAKFCSCYHLHHGCSSKVSIWL